MDTYFENGTTRMFWLMLDDPRLYEETAPAFKAEIEAAAAIEAFVDEQDETKPCTCGQSDCPLADTGPRPFGIVGGEVMEFGNQRGVTQIPF